MKKKKKISWFKTTLTILIICGIAGTILAAVLFKNVGDRTYASANIQFSFESAGEGKAPNGYPFDVKRMTSDDVITAALEAASLSDRYTADQIGENLSVNAVYPEDIVKKLTRYNSILEASDDQQAELSEYRATIYNVQLYNNFDTGISSAELTDFLKTLLETYRIDFARTGGPSLSRTDPISNLYDYDYTQQLQLISEASKQQSAYAQEIAEHAPDFRQGRKGFDDVIAHYEYLDSDIDRLNAFISLNAISKDRDRLQNQYEMELRSLNWEMESTQKELDRLEELVNTYEKDGIIYVSTSGALQKVSSNASDTYDKLVTKHKEITDRVTSINADILKYQTLLDDMTGSEASGEAADTEKTVAAEKAGDTEKAADVEEVTEENVEAASSVEGLTEEELDQMTKLVIQRIQGLVEKKNSITADFKGMLNAYTQQEINSQTVSIQGLKYHEPSFLSGAFIKQVIKTAGPICVLAFIICMVWLLLRRRKEEIQ